jgi:RsmE family RNA methyltransferase
VNLILFEPAEIDAPLPRRDPRAVHVLDVLRRKAGDDFDAGIVNGPRGKATVVAIDADSLTLRFVENFLPAPLDPITLIVGLPRPQTARDILRDATTLGVAALHFALTEKGDRNYASSTLWRSGEWRRHLVAGAEQAFDTRLPHVTHGRPLAEIVATLPPADTRLAVDNYESPAPLSTIEKVVPSVTLALGSERGWSAVERALFRENNFSFVHLGSRVLRTESACTVALALVKAKLGTL